MQDLRAVVQEKTYDILGVLLTGFSDLTKTKEDGLDEMEAGAFMALQEDFAQKLYPRLSTVLACAELLGYDLQLVPREPKSKIILPN